MYEDSEKFATRRRERSEAVAVDFTWVMHESRKTQQVRSMVLFQLSSTDLLIAIPFLEF